VSWFLHSLVSKTHQAFQLEAASAEDVNGLLVLLRKPVQCLSSDLWLLN
jgi:hypothetical protein